MNARTGRELWSFRPGAIESSPLVVDGTIYFGSWDHYVYAIDVRTKKVKWRFLTDDQVVAGPAYSHGTIYMPSSSGHLYAINAWTGRERWRASSFSRFGRREYFYATPTVAYGRVFIGNADGYVYSYGAKSGNLIWAQRAGTYVYTAAAVWRKTVYVGTWDGWVVAFDAATGRTRWRHDSPGGVSGAPTVMDGLLYYATLGGFGGRHQRRVEPGANQTFALDARTGKRVGAFATAPIRPSWRTATGSISSAGHASTASRRRTPPRPQSDSVREVQRYAPTAIVLALLAATAVAFVTTQRQKLEPSPVGRIAVDPFLSPVCRCDKRTATIFIGLRRTDTVTLDLVSSAGKRVRTLVDSERYRAKSAVNVEWDGRDDEGRIVPDGSYRPRLTLESGARSFVLRNPIELDTRAPKMTVTRVSPKVFSPDGDGRNDQVIVRYRVDEPAHGILRVDGVRPCTRDSSHSRER